MSDTLAAPPSPASSPAAYDVRTVRQGVLPLLRSLRLGLLPVLLRMDTIGGDVARVVAGPRRTVLLRHPELVRALLVEHNDAFTKSDGLQLAKDVLGEGLLTSEPPLHTRQRRLVLPAFHHQKLRRYAEAMVAADDEAAEGWADGERLDVDAAMNRLTLVIAGRTLFSAEIADEASEVSRAITAAMRLFNDRVRNPFAPLLNRLPLPASRAFWAAQRDLDATVLALVAERRAALAAGAAPKDDLLQMLLDAHDEDGSAMTDRQVRDEAMTLLLAGHETTAGALAWTWLLLARHPEARARLDAELDAVLAGRAPAFDDVKALPYTRAVFAEAMRLRPPAWVVGREAARTVELAPGVTLERGETVLFLPLSLHRDPRFWDDPDAFRPERFLAPEGGAFDPRGGARHRFAYLPFSAGRRGCIGEQFAWTEGVLVVAALARRWRLDLAGPEPGLFGSVTLRPDATIPMRATRRPGR